MAPRLPAERSGFVSKAKEEQERLVDRPELICLQTARGSAEALGIHRGRLLHEDTCLASIDPDRGPEGGGGSAR